MEYKWVLELGDNLKYTNQQYEFISLDMNDEEPLGFIQLINGIEYIVVGEKRNGELILTIKNFGDDSDEN